MPTYEYECLSCAHTFEIFQSMSDEPLKKCPQCGHKVRRLIYGGAGVIFKGSGFYITDKNHGSNSIKPAKTGDAAAADSSASSSGPASSAGDTGAKTEKTPSGEKSKSAAEPVSAKD